LFERLAEIAFLLFVFPSERTLFPNVRPAFAAARFRCPLLEGEMVADRIILNGRWMASRLPRPNT
jgi:hypothetical protein